MSLFPDLEPVIRRAAIFSDCGRYRYVLSRVWEPDLPVMCVVGLNPSTADANREDRTSSKCVYFAKKYACGGLYLVNLFAFKATKPTDMMREHFPVGPKNDYYIAKMCDRSDIIVAAWGVGGSHMGRGRQVCRLLSEYEIMCLGVTEGGYPRHPLFVKNSTKLEEYRI